MTIEERKARIADIESIQEQLLARIIEIAKKLEKKSVKAAIDSAIAMVNLGLEIRMLEAEKQLIISAPLPKSNGSYGSGMLIVQEGEKEIFHISLAEKPI